ncbi:MAG: dTMP kinase [Synergistaceae bacterium]|nr:dTMP kinase [Synergistaceae bacterium]
MKQNSIQHKRELFIAFEGIDGSGKSTQIRRLAARLSSLGHECYETAEPTDGPVGLIIRQIMAHKIKADNRVIAGLFVADRLDHLTNEINGIANMVKNGITVLTDRYYLSSYAYQGVFVPMSWVIEANSLSAAILRPSLNIFIDVDPEIAARRVKDRSHAELYETLDTLTKIRAQYFKAFDAVGREENIVIIDGNQSADKVEFDIWESIKNSVKC